jgi:uncharacterized protein YuzE
MRIEYDAASDHAYLHLTNGTADNTFTFSEEEFRPLWGVNLDFDAGGHLIGIEFENASQLLPRELLEQADPA